MAVDLPFDEAIEALRAVVKTAFGLPDSTPIPEAGTQPVKLGATAMALIDTNGEVALNDVGSGNEWGRAVLNLGEVLPFTVWYLAPRVSLSSLRAKLRALVQALIADRTLSGVVTTLRVTGTSWDGKSKEWPFDLDVSEGAQAGYVSLELVILETYI